MMLYRGKLTRSERKILTGLDHLASKSASREVCRRWAKLTPRGAYLVLERMQERLLIARNREGVYQMTYGGMRALESGK